MRVAEREEEGMRVTERTSEIRWTKEMNNNRIRFSLLRFIFSLSENEREFCFLTCAFCLWWRSFFKEKDDEFFVDSF